MRPFLGEHLAGEVEHVGLDSVYWQWAPGVLVGVFAVCGGEGFEETHVGVVGERPAFVVGGHDVVR